MIGLSSRRMDVAEERGGREAENQMYLQVQGSGRIPTRVLIYLCDPRHGWDPSGQSVRREQLNVFQKLRTWRSRAPGSTRIAVICVCGETDVRDRKA